MATTVNTTNNITNYLATLTDAQLERELERVRMQYQGLQIRYITDATYDRWQAHIELIEDEIGRRG